jgi:hypothetical protein
MVERSMIEGRTVLVTCVDDYLRPVADRLQATFIQITFEDDGDTRYYATGRHKVPPVGPLRRVTPFR